MDKFVDRVHEFEILNKEYQRKGASFVVIYGRRRVGKSTLIAEFCKDKPSISFLATEENEFQNREAMRQTASVFPGLSFLSDIQVNSWNALFSLIVEHAHSSRKLIIVIDEFQYLGKANSAFPSILMKIWEEILKAQNIMLILCGSLIRMMRSQVLNYDSPLYGRRTAQICMKQIPFSYYHEFDTSLSYDEQIMRYAVTGGVPKYIDIFESPSDIYTGIEDHILDHDAFLYSEPEFLLQKEVSEVGTYFSILRVIALGAHRITEIASRLETQVSKLTKYIETLIELDLLRRDVPITEENPEKSKMGQYWISDNFIRFWFAFVYPNKSLLEMGRTQYVMEKVRNHFIDNHVSYVYEEICREKMWDLSDQLPQFNRVGRWWNKKEEIDIAAYDSVGHDLILGECKYSLHKKDLQVLQSLMAKADAVPFHKGDRNLHYVLFSRSGFTDDLTAYSAAHSNVHLISP